jgi:hypothetical protein
MTGALKLANGLVATPALAFGSDTNTGIYRIGADNIGISANGAKVIDIATTGAAVTGSFSTTTSVTVGNALTVTLGGITNTAGVITNAVGAVGAPSYTFAGDLDCGMYRIGANNIGLAVNGAKVIDIATTGAAVTGALSATTSITAGNGLTVTTGSVSLPAGSVANSALAAPAGMTFLSTQTASNSAQIDFTTGLNDTYDRYVIALSNVKPQTDDVALYVRIGTGVGPTYQSSGYGYAFRDYFGGVDLTSASAAQIACTRLGSTTGVGNASGEHLDGTFEFDNPETSDQFMIGFKLRFIRANADMTAIDGAGAYFSVTAITGIRFFFSSGNIVSGRFTMYGVNKA